MTMTLAQLARAIDAQLVGDGSRAVDGCAPIESAGPDEIAFLANSRYTKYLNSTRAAAVIVDHNVERQPGKVFLLADDPYFAFRKAMIQLHGFRDHPGPMDGSADGCAAVSPRAAVHPDAKIGRGTIVHPFAVVEQDATVGERTVLYPGVYIGPGSAVGDDCLLYPGVAVYDRCVIGDRVTLHANTVVGNDGFGYATHGGEHHKIPQHGIVVIEDDVELGAGCAIERAAMGETRIGRGTKFADLISIGHGAHIGQHCLFVSLVGVSGSTDIGNYVVFGGQVGVAGHLSVGDFVQAAAKSGIINNVPANTKVGGIPAIEFNKAKRNAAVGMDLAGLAKRVRELEQRVKELESAGEEAPPGR